MRKYADELFILTQGALSRYSDGASMVVVKQVYIQRWNTVQSTLVKKTRKLPNMAQPQKCRTRLNLHFLVTGSKPRLKPRFKASIQWPHK